jgi:DivIVA domain-containing protein
MTSAEHDERTTATASRGWVPLSPDQVRQRTFRENQRGRRGYRREDVDAFLGRVADEVQRWSAAYNHMDNEVRRLRNYFRGQGIDPAAPRAPIMSLDAVNTMAQAQAHADQLIANAQAHARAMQFDAREQAEAIVAKARREADHAAHAYRAEAGEAYTADREQVERLASLGRSILCALNGASTQLDGASAQMRAIAEAFTAELTKTIEPTGRQLSPPAAPPDRPR